MEGLDICGLINNVISCTREYSRGKYHCTTDLLFDLFELACFANKNKNCQLSYSWFQASQTGGQKYSDTSPFSIPWLYCLYALLIMVARWQNTRPGKSYWGGRLSTVDLLALTSLYQLVFILKILFFLFYKTSYLNEEVNCPELSPQLVFPDSTHNPKIQGLNPATGPRREPAGPTGYAAI